MSASLNSQHSTLNWPSPSPRLHPRMWHRHPADEYMGWKPMPLFKDWPNWEVVSSYSSATALDSHGISCADPLFQARKELDREVAARAPRCKIYLRPATKRRPRATIEPCAASVSSCSTNARRIASRFSVAVIALAMYRK